MRGYMDTSSCPRDTEQPDLKSSESDGFLFIYQFRYSVDIQLLSGLNLDMTLFSQ